MEPALTLFGVPDAGDAALVQVLPVPYDATTSYRSGAAMGPKAILAASAQIDLLDADVGAPHEAGVHMEPESSDILMRNQVSKAAVKRIRHMRDKNLEIPSDLAFVNEAGQKNNSFIYEWACKILKRHQIPVLVGGDHSTPFGNIKACAESIEEGIGVLHLDAHCDLRNAYEGFLDSHASIMYNVVSHIPSVKKLVQVGIRDFCEEELQVVRNSQGKIVTYFDKILRVTRMKGQWHEACSSIVNHLPQHIYLSFDIDGLNPTLCPQTGTPVPGGLHWDEIIVLLETLVASGRKIVGLDLNEVAVSTSCPPEELGNVWDANVGARLLYKMIGFTLMSQGVDCARPPQL